MKNLFENKLALAVFLFLYIFLSRTEGGLFFSLIPLAVVFAFVAADEDLIFCFLASVVLALQIFLTDSSFFVTVMKIAAMLSGVCLGFCIRYRFDFAVSLAAVSGAGLLVVVAWILYENISSGTYIINTVIDKAFVLLEARLAKALSDEDMLRYFQNTLLQNGSFSAVSVHTLISEFVSSVRAVSTVLVPSMLVTLSAIFSFVCMRLCAVVMESCGRDMSHLVKFENLRMDRLSMWILLISMYCSDPDNFTAVSVFFSNVMMLIFAVAFFCGLSAVVYYIKHGIKSGVKKLILSLAALFVFIGMFDVSFTFLVMLGIIDVFWDIRILVGR